jgi:membrane protein YqaA with SNARE-associated domain
MTAGSAGDLRAASRVGARVWLAAAAIWGFAEATLFFFVPDMLLSYVALRRGWRFALAAALVATLAALAGGWAMYAWGASHEAQAAMVLDAVPAIAPEMIATVRAAMAGDWHAALFTGAVSGVPYKIYAVEAGAAGINLPGFLALSIGARFLRFAGTILLTELGRRTLARLGLERYAIAVLGGFWLCLYAVYFAVMPN